MQEEFWIPFTQYLRPNGERRLVKTQVDLETMEKAMEIFREDFRFEIEELSTGDISMTISDGLGDYAWEICSNSDQVPVHVKKMIMEFDVKTGLKMRESFRDD